jgi:hypothetical protein
MKAVRIAPLVEGDGEVTAVPVLLRRMIQDIDRTVTPIVRPGFRHPSGSMLRIDGLERAISAVAEIHPAHTVLVIMDTDDHCPKQLGPELQLRAKARSDLEVSVVLAHREYEAWFLAAAESLAGRRNLRRDLTAPAEPEDIRDAKGWLTTQMPASARYSPTQDQAALSSQFDLNLARKRSRSFRKLWKEVERIVKLAASDSL